MVSNTSGTSTDIQYGITTTCDGTITSVWYTSPDVNYCTTVVVPPIKEEEEKPKGISTSKHIQMNIPTKKGYKARKEYWR